MQLLFLSETHWDFAASAGVTSNSLYKFMEDLSPQLPSRLLR